MNAGNRTLTRAHRSTPHASTLIKIANKHMQSTWSDFIMNVYILLILFTDRRIFPDVSIERVPSSPIQGRRN
jgi:MFS superfamily sulfate permease-like transporter